MDNYYSQQASMPYFSGHYRQRGSGFGALAAGLGRVALPIARKFIWPAAKKIGRELISQAAPELVDVVTKKKSAKCDRHWLSHKIENFFVVASWQMRENDFGLLSCRLAVVSDD